MRPLLQLLFALVSCPIFAQSVVINEIHHSPQDNDELEFIELFNPTSSAIDLSNWEISRGIYYQFPKAITLEAGAYLVVAKNPYQVVKQFKLEGEIQILGPFKGRLDGDGDHIVLKNTAQQEMDKVHYKNQYPWSVDKSSKEKSLQLVNPQFDNRIGTHWASTTPSPCVANQLVYTKKSIPIIKSIRQHPQQAKSNDIITVRANVRNAHTVVLAYQIVQPGHYIALADSAYQKNWTKLKMLDNGLDGDKLANDRIFTVQIPAHIQQHRHLIRYKIIAKGDTTSIAPHPHSPEPNFAYYTYDKLPDYQGHRFDELPQLPLCQLLAKSEEVQHLMFEYEKRAYTATGTVIYNGKVYDHIGFRSRGYNNRHSRTKRNLKFNFHSHNKIEVLNNWGQPYATKRDKLVLSGGWLLDQPNLHGLGESVLYRLFSLQGTSACHADYIHLRVVKHENEVDSLEGDFWGLYLTLENFDGDFLKTHQLPDANVYSYKPFKLRHHSNKKTDLQKQIYTEWDSSYHSTHPITWWKKTLDWDNYLGFLIGNELAGNRETGYRKQHWWTEYHHPKKGWQFFPWDLDKTWSSSRGKSTISYSIFTKAFEHEALEKEYKNQLRSVLDLLYNEEQAYQLIDEEARLIYQAGAAYSFADLDKLRWGHDYEGDFGNQVAYLKKFVKKRRQYILEKLLDDAIPNSPTLVYTGKKNYPIENLSFRSDSIDKNNFRAIQWRVAEVSSNTNPFYARTKAKTYEIDCSWEREEAKLLTSLTLPLGTVKPNRSYRIRVRVQDSTGYYSHWSAPIEFIPKEAVKHSGEGLVINELLFNGDKGLEFIEIHNSSSKDIPLTGFAFQAGIHFQFPANSNIPANSFLVLTNNQAKFKATYGFEAQAVYKGNLSKNGETLVLKNAYNEVVDSLSYSPQWKAQQQGEGLSLELTKSDSDNTLAANWQRSYVLHGTPGAMNSSYFHHQAASHWHYALYSFLIFVLLAFWRGARGRILA